MTTTTRPHDSLTCNLGPDGQPCDLCAWANESGYMSKSASLATIRAALFDVLDAGWQCGAGCDLQHAWSFPTEMFMGDEQPSDTDLRLRDRFVDAVIERVSELQRSPHSFDATLNNYQSGYADGWAAAHMATLREQNADLREMLRLAQVRRKG